MDIVLFIIAMLVFYVLPEVLKRRRKTEYQYPEIPDRVPPPPGRLPQEPSAPGEKQLPPGAIPIPGQMKKPAVAAPETPPAAAIDPGTLSTGTAMQTLMPQEAASPQETAAAWQGGLDYAAVVNGIIYAEILQPPKALRRRRGLR